MYEKILLGLLRVDFKWFLLWGRLPARHELVHHLHWLKAAFRQLMPIQAQPELLTAIIRLSLILEDRLMDLAHLLQPLDLLLPHPILILYEHWRLDHIFFLVAFFNLRLIWYSLKWIDYLEILLVVVKYLLKYWRLLLILLDSLQSQCLRFEAHYTLCVLKAWVVALTHDGPRLLVFPPRNNGRRFCVVFSQVISSWWEHELLVWIRLRKLETRRALMRRLRQRWITWKDWGVRRSFLQFVSWRDRHHGLDILSQGWSYHDAIVIGNVVVLVLCTRSHL